MEIDLAAQLWSNELTRLLPGPRLPYELRAMWGCLNGDCERLLVGLKSGEIFEIFKPQGDQIPPLKERATLEGGVYAMEGCPTCDSELVVGGREGRTCRYAEAATDKLIQTRAETAGTSKIREVRRAEGGAIFAIDNHTGLWWSRTASTTYGTLINGRPRWLLRRGVREGGDTSDRGVWYALSAEGHITSVRTPDAPGGGTSALSFGQVGRLRGIPLCVAADRVHGRLRAILYGTRDGLRVATIDAEGIRSDRALTWDGPVEHLRLLKIFDTEHILVCDPSGGVRVRRWAHPEDSAEGAWYRWPPMSSEVLGVHIWPAPESKSLPQHGVAILRDHRIVGVELHHRDYVRGVLRAGPGASLEAHEMSDELRHAEILLSEPAPAMPRLGQLVACGGQGTLSAAISRIHRRPALGCEDVQRLGEKIILAAAREGFARVLTVARELHHVTRLYLRELPTRHEIPQKAESSPAATLPPDPRLNLERWVRLLEKYFLDAHTFTDKYLRLDDLADRTRKRAGVDHFVYEALHQSRGYVVEAEWEISAPARVLTAAMSSGQYQFWALQEDGVLHAFEEQRNGWDEVGKRTPKNYAHESNTIGQFSRILLPPTTRESSPSVAPCDIRYRGHIDERISSRLLRWPAEEYTKRYTTEGPQVYSALRFDDDYILLGLRGMHQPLAWWAPDGSVTFVEDQCWGTARHTHGQHKAGLRRVYCLEKLCVGYIVAGAQDGHLRILKVDERRIALVTDRCFGLGAPIRRMKMVETKHTGSRMLYVTTIDGQGASDLFCFEVRMEGDAPALRLRFRDLLLSPAVALLDWPGTRDLPDQICVLDGQGRLTPYVTEQMEKSPEMLGSRLPQMRALLLGRTALHLEDDKVAVSGQRSDGQEVIRVLRLLRRSEKRPFGATTRTTEQLSEIVKADFAPVAEQHRLALLAAVPIGHGALRAMLADSRLKPGPDGTRRDVESNFKEILRETRANQEDNSTELKGLLCAAVAFLEDKTEREETQISLLKTALQELVDSRGRRIGGAARVRQRAIMARYLLNRRSLELSVKDHQLSETLQRWVDDLLQDPDEHVCFEAARALNDALLGYLRFPDSGANTSEPRSAPLLSHPATWAGEPAAQDDAPPVASAGVSEPDQRARLELAALSRGAPPVASAGWLLDALTRYLHARPTAQVGPECEATTWAITGVLVNLIRLYPDSALIIFDHLSVSRVHTNIFRILVDRFRGSQREDNTRIYWKLHHYLPTAWLDQDPTLSDVQIHCDRRSKLVKAVLAENGPDKDYVDAYCKCYAVFARMARIQRPQEFEEFADLWSDVENSGDPSISLRWMQALWPQRVRYLQFTITWQKAVGALVREGIDKVKEKLLEGRGDPTGWPLGRVLLEPEAMIARVLANHWLSLFERHLPRPGDSIGDYVLGHGIEDAHLVFEARKKDKEDFEFVIATRPGRSPRERTQLLDIWERLVQVAAPYTDPGVGHKVLPVISVCTRDSVPALIMHRVDGRSLPDQWGKVRSEDRLELAWRLSAQIGRALDHLHAKSLFHGDLRPENILLDLKSAQSARFYLVDFDLAGVVRSEEDSEDQDALRGARAHYSRVLPTHIKVPIRDPSFLERATLLKLVLGLASGKDIASWSRWGDSQEHAFPEMHDPRFRSWYHQCRQVWTDWLTRMRPDKLVRLAVRADPYKVEALTSLRNFLVVKGHQPISDPEKFQLLASAKFSQVRLDGRELVSPERHLDGSLGGVDVATSGEEHAIGAIAAL